MIARPARGGAPAAAPVISPPIRGLQTSGARARSNAEFKAGWRIIGGKRCYFRSKWEANYARLLEWLKAGGHIKDWQHENRTYWFDKPATVNGRKLSGVRRGVVSYLPDFTVTENDGSEAVHEVKGFFDARSKTKLSRMRLYYPDTKVTVIDRRSYLSMSRKLRGLIPGWE